MGSGAWMGIPPQDTPGSAVGQRSDDTVIEEMGQPIATHTSGPAPSGDTVLMVKHWVGAEMVGEHASSGTCEICRHDRGSTNGHVENAISF